MPATKKIIFINKTADSKTLTQSEGLERSRIFSHVQRTASTRGSERSIGPSPPASLEKTTRRAPKQLKRLNLDPASCDTPSPRNDLRLGEQLEQFHNHTIPVTWYFNALTGFYSSPLVQRVFPAKAVAGASQDHTLALLSHDALLRNSLLCTVATAMYIESDNLRHKTSSLYFMGEAICHLKLQISDGPGEASGPPSMYAIALLLWAECLHGNTAHILAHMAGLQQLIAVTGGLRSNPLPAAAGILACSYLCSAMMRTRPVLAPTLLNDAQISQATWIALNRCPGPELKPMTSRFFTPTNALVIGPDLLELITDQYSCILFKELCLLERLEPTHDDAQSIYTKQMMVEHALLSMPFDQTRDSLTPAQDVIRLALFVFAQPIIAMFSKPSFAFTRCISRQIKETLESSALSVLWAPAHDLLLWVLFICAHISRGRSEWPWTMALIVKIADTLTLDAVDDLQHLLEGFYFFPTHFGSTLQDVWADVERSRGTRGSLGSQ